MKPIMEGAVGDSVAFFDSWQKNLHNFDDFSQNALNNQKKLEKLMKTFEAY